MALTNSSADIKVLDGLMDDEALTTMFYVVSCTGVILSVAGSISNVINVFTFLSIGIRDGVTAGFLGLACSDFLVSFSLFISLLCTMLELKERTSGRWIYDVIDPVAINMYVNNASAFMYVSTILTTVYIAVARCMCVASPLTFRNSFTRYQSTVIIVIFNIASISLVIPIFATMGVVKGHSPSVNKSRYVIWFSLRREKIKDAMYAISQTIIPFSAQIVIIVCLFIMKGHLIKAAKFRQITKSSSNPSPEKEHSNPTDLDGESPKQNSSYKLSGRDLNVIKQVILVSGVFVVCNIPGMITSIAGLVEPGFDLPVGKRRYFRLYITAHMSRRLFDLVNGSVNTLFYLRYNSKFRKQLKQYYCLKK